MTMLQWDFRKLSTTRYETNRYEIGEAFQNISVTSDTAFIEFLPSDTDGTSVVCYEQEKLRHSAAVQDGTLVISVHDTRKWYDHIGISWSTPKITVYLPESRYGHLRVEGTTGDVSVPDSFSFDTVNISVTTGDVTHAANTAGKLQISTNTGFIRVRNITADSVNLSVSTGSVFLTTVTCPGDMNLRTGTGKTVLNGVTAKNLTSVGSTGDLILQRVTAAEKFSLKRNTGDIQLDGCDAAEIFAETSTGDVTGTLLSEKVFITHTDTGRVDVPKTVSGGRCEITTDTGDIRIQIG